MVWLLTLWPGIPTKGTNMHRIHHSPAVRDEVGPRCSGVGPASSSMRPTHASSPRMVPLPLTSGRSKLALLCQDGCS